MSIAGANIFEDSASEGVGQTTVIHPDIDTDPGSGPPDHIHIDYDLAHKACLAEIASLFEDIQTDLRIITDRGDDRSKGIYQREADSVANNPANIAKAALDYINLQQSQILDLVNAEVGNPTNLGNTSAANYNAIRNTTNGASGFVGGDTSTNQSAGYGASASTAIVGSDGKTYYENTVPFDQLVTVKGDGKGLVTYSLDSIRNLPIQSQLMNIITGAAQTAGVNITITSGGQVPVREGGENGRTRIGSNRYDKGFAADIQLLDGTGTRLETTDPKQLLVILKFVEECKNTGITGVGMGNGYMNNETLTVDIAWKAQLEGLISGIRADRYWGGTNPTNSVNAPQYLKDIMTTRGNIA